jgi:FHS family L-fucose permease-like MFS transporter
MGVAGGAVFPPMQGAISEGGRVKVSFFIVVPCFLYIFGWAMWIWNKDGRRWTATKASREIEREVEVNAGGAYPPAAGLGEKTQYENSELKEDLERVERA